MATEAPHACPFCSESHLDRPEQCFRCESPLTAWWPFEDAARQPRAQVPGVARPLAVRKGTALASLAVAVLLGAALARLGTRAVPSSPPAPSPSPLATSTAVPPAPEVAPSANSSAVSYRVQRGDSLWRIAAALTGDGRNWRTLWPEREPSEPLEVGTVLDVSPADPRR